VDDGVGAPGQGDRVDSAEFERDASPVQPGASFGDADEQQGEPAEQDVGADAGFAAVEHRPQFEGGLQVAEATLGLEQVLVAQRDVLGAQVGIGGGEQVIAV
jgi:hypothetical protein